MQSDRSLHSLHKELCILGYPECASKDPNQTVQANMGLLWGHISKDGFSDIVAEIHVVIFLFISFLDNKV